MGHPLPKTYVSFVFSPVFINESKVRETYLVEEKKVTDIEPGTLALVLKKYKEVEVASRDLSALQAPKGALYFWFYDRLTVTARYKGEPVKMQSKPLDESGRHYIENEGVFFARGWLEMETKYPNLPPERRKQLISLMDKDKNNSSRIFQVLIDGPSDSEENFLLRINDRIISPHDVQMVDTDIPWPNK